MAPLSLLWFLLFAKGQKRPNKPFLYCLVCWADESNLILIKDWLPEKRATLTARAVSDIFSLMCSEKSRKGQAVHSLCALIHKGLYAPYRNDTRGNQYIPLWQLRKQPPYDIHWCSISPSATSNFWLGRAAPLSELLFLPPSPMRVAGPFIDVEPNGSWKRPFSPGCWHRHSDQTIKRLVKR